MNEIVTLAESLIPLISGLRHTTENDRRIAEPIVQAIRKFAARHERPAATQPELALRGHRLKTRSRPLPRWRAAHRLPSCPLFR
jgi:hypothetical protein